MRPQHRPHGLRRLLCKRRLLACDTEPACPGPRESHADLSPSLQTPGDGDQAVSCPSDTVTASYHLQGR